MSTTHEDGASSSGRLGVAMIGHGMTEQDFSTLILTSETFAVCPTIGSRCWTLAW